MSQVITNAFEQYWQSSLAAEQPVVLDEFVLADIPNLDITSPINPDTGLPPAGQIVYRQDVDQRGRVNNNAVAYSIVMDTAIGDFSFNAMYLRNKANGVVGMIVYKGRETKLKTDLPTAQTGNSLVKSMLMGYDQAAEATLTNVDAGTWQIDYAARLRGQDEDLRQLASQLYGHHTFIGDGFKVVEQAGAYEVTPGVAIVGGLRIALAQPEVIYPGTKPIGVWVDVHRSGSLLSEHQNHFTLITSVADLTDHLDGNGYQHFVAKLATVQADSTVVDGRGQGSASSIVGFQQSGVGAAERPVQDKMRETVSVPDYDGPGVAAFDSAKAWLGLNPALLPIGDFDIGANVPDYEIKGPGKVIANGVTSGGAEVSYNPARESVFYTPATYQREQQGVNYPPLRGADFITSSYNTVFSLGSKLQDHDKNIRYTVAFGNMIGSAPLSWGYVDAFGGNTLAYAGNIERTTAVGSESLAWFGAPNQQWLRDYQHDWWRQPGGVGGVPGDPEWDSSELGVKHPGIGARLAAFTDYATDSTLAGFTATLGRDAGNHLVKGIRNVFSGYGAAQNMFVGSFNCAYGALALRDVVFGDYLTAIGDQAGQDCLDSTNALFVGYGAGRTLKKASNSVVIGSLAADGHLSAENSILIGPNIAKAIPAGEIDNALAIGITQGIPLLSGDFLSVGAGVNIQPRRIRARHHVRYTDSGSTLIPDSGLLVEGFNAATITIETNNTGFGNLNFADTEGTAVGGVTYGHGSNALQLRANGAERWRVRGDGGFHPAVDNTYSSGTASNRSSVVFAGTGTINTSDGKEKTAPLPITDTVLDAWAAVQLITFQWLESIRVKGEDAARWHFGVIAQQVRDAFLAHGLDGTRYGMLCYDEWADEYVQVQTNKGEKVTKTRTVNMLATVTATREVFVDQELEDGSKIKVVVTEEYQTPKQVQVYLYTAPGVPKLNDDGTRAYIFEPVMEDVEEEYQDDAPPEFTDVLETAAGNRWGIRADQCLFLEAAWQRRNHQRQQAENQSMQTRLEKLEAA